jgi:hypothetical protein
LPGLSIGQALLNLVPSTALARPQRQAGADAPKIAQRKFRPSASSFAARNRRKYEIAAVQRGWRDFRIAQ